MVSNILRTYIQNEKREKKKWVGGGATCQCSIFAVVGTVRCAVRTASSGATREVGRYTAQIPPGIRAATAQRAVPTAGCKLQTANCLSCSLQKYETSQFPK